MSTILTILVALMSYFLSHSFSLLLDVAKRTGNDVVIYSTQGLQLLFPPMESLNIKDVIGSYTQFTNTFFLYNTLYSLAYLAVILYLTTLIFNKKKFEN
jgi:hypothetical protein